MQQRPRYHASVEDCVTETIRRVGKHIRLGIPLGLGKPNQLVNAFYRRACDDPDIKLHILTALSLSKPGWSNDLQRRFVEPLAERLFEGYPDLDYVGPYREGELPENIRVTEFYFQPGSLMNSPPAQQAYISSNYSHAVRDLVDAGINVVAQMVAREEEGGAVHYSLSCNPDLTLDLVPLLRQAEREDQQVAILAQVNRNLPFMYGDAVVEPEYFDMVVDEPKYDFRLFGVPNRPVSTADHFTGLHVSTLIKDAGTLQIGIGSLGDAICYALGLRHTYNEEYRAAVDAANIRQRWGGLIERIGGLDPFDAGLYASSEMLVDGFLKLYEQDVLKRRVYPDADVQRLLNEGAIKEEVTPQMIDTLVSKGVISKRWTAEEYAGLQRVGIVREEVKYEDGFLRVDDWTRIPADLDDTQARRDILERCLGEQLQGGHVAHACFFVGPEGFYEDLREMDAAERARICMTGISYVNELFGEEGLKRVQRQQARFINAGMIATLGGAVASDGLEDGRVVSGVGGQYNFVAMAHALEDGRSVLMVPSTREEGGEVVSNIRFNYGHTTVPRHLRDILVTEYGIADLRGRSDEEVAIALIEIADARFQEELLEMAKEAEKVAPDYSIPDHARENTPERLDAQIGPLREKGLFPSFPFGTDLTEEEVALRKALTSLKALVEGEELKIPGVSDLQKTVAVPDEARPYLERLDLDRPNGPKEVLMQRAVVYALTTDGVI